jgi:EAL domain-containing protein (putative c-di-GMP-specific phosphodiesterase class I)
MGMQTPSDSEAGESPSPHLTSVLPSLGEAVATVGSRFDQHGAMGLLLIDASVALTIEERYGEEAASRSLGALGELVSELAGELLPPGDLVVAGETGRSELLVIFFRDIGAGDFLSQELPDFESTLATLLDQRGLSVFYPYLRTAPRLPMGTSASVRNPKLNTRSQLRSLIEEARDDADLKRRLAAREERRSFMQLILGQRVTSVYEPIVEVTTKTVFGYESLARGPEGPFHSPLALFGMAESQNLVFELDCLCRRSGLEGAVGLPDGTKLFLNVLPTCIHDPAFRADRLIRTLAKSELSPQDVVFEISEQESIHNFGVFKEIRDSYRHLGFQFALDDTGAGYAGLETLLEIEPEYIKVDRAFVSGIDEDASRQDMLAALLTMAEKTGSRVIGEGLDRLEELEMLGELGIHFGQGWLFGRPTPLRAGR